MPCPLFLLALQGPGVQVRSDLGTTIMAHDEKDESGEDIQATRQDVGASRKDLEKPQPWSRADQYFDAFGEGSNTPIVNDPVDGMPRPADDWVAAAPRLDAEMVCLEKDALWVELFAEENVASTFLENLAAVRNEGARKILKSRRSRFNDLGEELPRRTFEKDKVKTLFGLSVVTLLGFDPKKPDLEKVVAVRPERARCKHFVQQLDMATDIVSATGPVYPLHSYCFAMKSTGGAPLVLTDEYMKACTIREPKDLVTEDMIRERVRKKIDQGSTRKNEVLVPPPKKVERDYGPFFSCDSFSIAANPASKPGRFAMVIPKSAAEFSKFASSLDFSKDDSPRVLLVGMNVNDFDFPVESNFSGSVHTLLIDESDYAPEGLPTEEIQDFLRSWPDYARFQHLRSNLEKTPAFLASEAYNKACDIYVVGKDRRDVMFGAALILWYQSKTIVGNESDFRREHNAYFEVNRLRLKAEALET